MSTRTTSSSCRTGHHKDCSGRRRGKGKKRTLPCSCSCHKKPATTPAVEPPPGSERQTPIPDPHRIKCSNCGTIVNPPHHTCSGCSRDVIAPARGSPNPDPDRPACFGLCAEISAACDACEVYNACRRASV